MATLLVGSAVFGALGLALYKIIKKPKGCSECGGGCSGCSHSTQCH